MNALLSYHWARIWRKKSLWGILLVVIICQLLLETQVTPTAANPPFGAWIRDSSAPAHHRNWSLRSAMPEIK